MKQVSRVMWMSEWRWLVREVMRLMLWKQHSERVDIVIKE